MQSSVAFNQITELNTGPIKSDNPHWVKHIAKVTRNKQSEIYQRTTCTAVLVDAFIVIYYSIALAIN